MRRYIVFSIACLGLLISSISNYSGAVALPVITTDLKTSLILAGWILSAYALVRTIGMPLAGKLSEVLGSKAVFVASTVSFTVGSILSALAPNIYTLIGGRVVQAVGGSGFMPCAAGIVSDEFPEQRQRFIGFFSSIVPIGMTIGPNLGGWMVEAFGWRSIFWFNVPLGIIIFVLAMLLLPPDSRKGRATDIDFVGVGLFFGSISAFMVCLTEFGNTSGISWLTAAILFVSGMVLLIIFLRWERKSEKPFVDLELLRRKPFLAANIYNLIYGVGTLGVLSLIPLYAVSIYKMSILQSGVVLTPRSLGMIATSTISSIFIMKWGYRRPILAGTLLLAIGFALLSLEFHGIEAFGFYLDAGVLFFTVVGLCGIATGFAAPGSSNACIELMPDKVGTIIGLRGMFRQLGSSIGVTFATVVITVIGDFERAFFVVMLATALLTLISIPAVFLMPASAKTGASCEPQPGQSPLSV